jgi:hypothetical protein
MQTKWSPSDIEILIHCYCVPTPHPRLDAPAVQETIKMFLDQGIIEEWDERHVYHTTPKGSAWMNAICNTPLPVSHWLDDKGNVVG